MRKSGAFLMKYVVEMNFTNEFLLILPAIDNFIWDIMLDIMIDREYFSRNWHCQPQSYIMWQTLYVL